MKVLVIGDLHIDDRYTGRHKDYMKNCEDVLSRLTTMIQDESPTHIVLAGDIIGVNTASRLLRSRDTLLYVIQVLQEWKNLTGNEVYCIKGNHDISDKTGDFDLLVELGFLKLATHLDMSQARIHLIDYGSDECELAFKKGMSNVAVMHSHFIVDGYDDYVHMRGGVNINTMSNLSGVDLILSGHIHTPSNVMTTFIEGKKACLLYLGCPTRPKKDPDLWDAVNIAVLEDIDDELSVDIKTLGLQPFVGLFTNTFDDVSDEDLNVSGENKVEVLVEVLDNLNEYIIDGSMDCIAQLKRYKSLDEPAVEKAVGYIETAKGSGD